VTTIVTLVPDLMFGTRIEDVAKYLGYSIHSLNTSDDADAAMAREKPALVIVSLDAADWERAVRAAKRGGAHVLAFGSHKNVDAMRAAKDADCDEVVARSRMASELPNLLRKYAAE
jgi:hypothetical protein